MLLEMIMVSTKDNKKSKSNEQVSSEVVEPKKPFRFGPGNKFGGRPPGSRNKFAEEFVKDFLADWKIAGASAIQACRLEDPAAYLRVAASLIPKEFNINNNESVLATIIDQFSDEQLDQFFGVIDAIAAGSLKAQGKGHKAQALLGSQPN